jgi:hypothetical protein
MTIAVCFNCGAKKFGSLVECQSCNRAPATDLDAAWSLACSDHHFPIETLEQISADMHSGGPRPRLSEDTLQGLLPEARRAMATLNGAKSGDMAAVNAFRRDVGLGEQKRHLMPIVILAAIVLMVAAVAMAP